MILAYLLLFMRRLIISTKYGYFRPEDNERLCLPAPDWDRNKTNRRLVGQGWLQPWLYPGLIEDELTVAMDENDICLQGIPLEVNDKNKEKFLQEDSSSLFPAKTSISNENEVASGFILFNIIKSVYSSPTKNRHRSPPIPTTHTSSLNTVRVRARLRRPPRRAPAARVGRDRHAPLRAPSPGHRRHRSSAPRRAPHGSDPRWSQRPLHFSPRAEPGVAGRGNLRQPRRPGQADRSHHR